MAPGWSVLGGGRIGSLQAAREASRPSPVIARILPRPRRRHPATGRAAAARSAGFGTGRKPATSAIRPPQNVPYLNLRDPIKRKLVTKAALVFWVTKGARQVVVTIENLRILAGSTHFYKSTGNTFVRNFVDIRKMIESNPIGGIFWKKIDPDHLMAPHVDCRFYMTSMDYARQHVIPAYLQADDKVDAPCERFIFQELSRTATQALAPRPFVHGLAGVSDQDCFDQSLGALDTASFCWVLPR